MKTKHMRSRPVEEEAWRFDNASSKKMIYIDDFGDARICYVISFFADIAGGGAPARPTIIMDALTGEIIKEFDALAYAAAGGPGGNLKLGNYTYGQQFPLFEVSASGDQCFMDTQKDGRSIDSLNDYYDGLDVHFSSGIFNKAFYILATKPGWNTRMAFEVFAEANQFYWEPLTDFIQGARGAIDAAATRGYPVQDVRDAFASVDIFIDLNTAPHADFEYDIDEWRVSFTDTSTCADCSITRWQWDFGDGLGAATQNPFHQYMSDGTYTVSLTVTDSSGQTDATSEALSVSGDSSAYGAAAGRAYQIQWIAKVQVGSFTRASQASGYSDFSADIIEAPLAAALPVVLAHGPTNSLYLKYWRVWADLNRDGDFEDAGEKLLERAGASTQPVKSAITIPAGVTEGHTRLRVAMSLNGYPAPCGTFNAGEVEDYTLAIATTAHAR